MSFEMGKGQFYVVMWQVVGHRGNWMCGVFRDEKGWCLSYRFWNSNGMDEKEWTSLRPGEETRDDSPEVTRERYVQLGDELAKNLVSTRYGDEVERLDLETDDAVKILAVMGEKGWVRESRMVNPLTGGEQEGGDA